MKYKIGDFVYWFYGDDIGYGNINEIIINKEGICYQVNNEREMGDYPRCIIEENKLYSKLEEFEKYINEAKKRFAENIDWELDLLKKRISKKPK